MAHERLTAVALVALLCPAALAQDAARLPDNALTIAKDVDGMVLLSWTESCLASDTDFGIYGGSLGDYYTHSWMACSTLGATAWTVPEAPEERYYLVVPRNDTHEGSYGRNGEGVERPAGGSVCLPQAVGLCPVSVALADIDSGLTSPQGNYRWMDAADQLYSIAYRESYDYTQAEVELQHFTGEQTFRGLLIAGNLKPHFAYQVKLAGYAGTESNEAIGLTGRWWQEEWNGSEWTNGQNLNNKGDGSSPSPNDATYFARRDIADSTSPTGRKYKFTGYLVFEYFITDEYGNAFLAFEQDSSYHVLWKTSQRTRTADDGPLQSTTFDVELPDPVSAYDYDYAGNTISVFGEWERLPCGGVFLPAGVYEADLILTEESFHGSGLAGGWAAAMGASVSFEVVP